MKQTFLLILTVLNLTSINCQNKTELSNIKGTEIFLFETECRNENSYMELKTKSEQKNFAKKYKAKNEIPVNKCLFYIDLDKCKTKSEPFLNVNDIEKFDWLNSKIVLKESGIEKLKNIEVPLRGLAFVIKLNGENIYAGWFWVGHSSFGCDRIWTWKIPKENELKLRFGFGGFQCGENPLTNEKLIRNIINN